jgi:hypothetical protein
MPGKIISLGGLDEWEFGTISQNCSVRVEVCSKPTEVRYVFGLYRHISLLYSLAGLSLCKREALKGIACGREKNHSPGHLVFKS